MRIFILLIALLWLPADAQAELREYSLTQHGLKRDFLVYVPDSLPKGRAVPLVLVLHGGGGSSRQILKSTSGRFNKLAERDGFIVAYPNAYRRIWDLGEGEISAKLSPRRDDLAFFDTVIAQISAQNAIDQSRIFATGISRGGQASFALACERPDTFRAVAPVAMSLPAFLVDDCRGLRRMGLAVINGVLDPIVPYAGGRIDVLGRQRDLVLGTEETLRLFARANRCDAPVTTQIGAVDKVEWQGCTAPVTLYRVTNGGHAWPGDKTARKRRQGGVNHDIDAADQIWAFFRRF